jgi:hypothetical protein
MTARRTAAVVALCAGIVHLGALWNRFALDDIYIIVLNPLVRSALDPARIFASPYWPAEFGGQLYRPLVVLTYALDRLVGTPAWFHAVNLAWHAGTAVAVALLARRLAGTAAGLVTGLLFAVHPVHVEAVANVVGRAELMAGACTVLAVFAALHGRAPAWSAAALGLGLLSKENAAVAPLLALWGWALGIGRPDRRRALAYGAAWLVVGAAYVVARALVLAPYEQFHDRAPVFFGLDAVAIRLTAVAAFADLARLLLVPATLRADYSPLERTAVTAVADARFLVGVAIAAVWLALLVWIWRRDWKVEALGLGWAGIAVLPVANLIVPIGVLVAERTLYLSSAGVVIAAAAAAQRLPARPRVLLVAVLCAAGAARSATRVPVWRDEVTLTASIIEDAPRSYRGPARAGGLLQAARQPQRALASFQEALSRFPDDAQLCIAAADAALTLGRPALADSLLLRAAAVCPVCDGLYRFQASAARARGDTATATALLARVPRRPEAP